jgi:hypothetical protein
MDKVVYDTCMLYFTRQGNFSSWGELANKFGYVSGEAIRSQFKRARKKARVEIKDYSKSKPTTPAKIICFDIEVSPMIAYTFDIWNNISPDKVIREKSIICWAAKELNDSVVFKDVVTEHEAIMGDDYRVVKSLWETLNSADILVGHNIKDFDIKEMNTRFLKHGLPPISSNNVIDTLLVSRQYFAFASNKLSFINKQLGIKQKIETSGFSLWKDCMNGEIKALRDMIDYCEGDVLSVEELYYNLRAFIKGHPNLGLYSDNDYKECPNCGSGDLSSNGYYYTTANKYESMRCNSCGALSRKKKTELSKEKSKNILRN